jgi:hypothetical protein
MGLLPISDDGGDYKFFLHAKPGAEGVVIYGPGLDGAEVARDFFDFLLRAAKNGVLSLVPDSTAP